MKIGVFKENVQLSSLYMQVGRVALFLLFHSDTMQSERKRFRRSYYYECNYGKKLNEEI